MSEIPAKTYGRRRSWAGERRVLFVEGNSDLLFYAELMEHLGVYDDCFIQMMGSCDAATIKNEMVLLLKPDNLLQIERVAVIIDGDENAAAALRACQGALRNAIRVEVSASGRWVDGKSLRAGAFVVNGAPEVREIESLAWKAWSGVAKNEGLKHCVDAFTGCAEKSGLRLKSVDKVRIGSVLSVLNEDDPRLGPGAKARIFDFNSPAFESLRTFLRGFE